MNKALKYTLYGVGGLVGAGVIGVGIFAATFDPNKYKPLIVEMVKDKKQRTLNIEGDIKLAFWPKLGADLGKVTLSEHQSDKEFAAIDSAKAFVAVMPLLRGELVVDTIKVDGVRANIVRGADGKFNFDDLVSKDDSESEEFKFDIDGVRVSNAAVSFDDQLEKRSLKISGLKLETGHVAKNEPVDVDTAFHIAGDNPVLDADMQFKGTLLADTEKKQYGVKGMALAVKGTVTSFSNVDLALSGDVDAKPEQTEFTVDGLKLALKADQAAQKLDVNLEAPKLVAKNDQVSGDKVKLDVTRAEGSDTMSAKFVIADLKGSAKAFESSGITGEISGKQGGRSLAGNFSSPFKGNLETLVFDLPKLAGNVDIKDAALPNGGAKIGFNLDTHADVKQEKITVGLAMNIDGSNLKGNVGLNGFKQSRVQFNLTADQLDLNKLLGANQKKPDAKPKAAADNKPADLSFLKTVLADGAINIGSIIYDKYRVSNLAATIKADGKALNVNPLALKLDDSTIKGRVGITQFERALYTFDLDIDRLDVDRYVVADNTPKTAQPAAASQDAKLDLSALKALNADGSLRIGNLKYGKTTASDVRVDLKADGGLVKLAPLAANLYGGSMNGSLNVDARATPGIAIRQDMKNVNIGPLLVDTIQNDMLEGRGTLALDVKTGGDTVLALKKALAGTAAIKLADGAIKGVDIAGTVRGIKNKLNFSSNTLDADQKKKTDFSEMSASFNIAKGVAHNDDLAMKSPLLRIAGNGDIDIGNSTLNYTVKPTVVSSLKGQGGAELDTLNGLTFPVKVTGTFAAPKYGFDFAAIATEIAKANVLNGAKPADALKDLLGGKKSAPDTAQPAPADNKKETTKDKTKKKLGDLLGL
ncbi:MAG: AsmA family protein [Methylobacillus sp.]|jgi:AsmA protein|nr:AsmA family protein [Methylobacillus sp.]